MDLLQDLGPDGCVAGFVGVHGGGFEVDDLGDAAGWRHFRAVMNWINGVLDILRKRYNRNVVIQFGIEINV